MHICSSKKFKFVSPMLIYSHAHLTVKPVSIVRLSMFACLLARHSVLPSVCLSACRTVHLVAPSLRCFIKEILPTSISNSPLVYQSVDLLMILTVPILSVCSSVLLLTCSSSYITFVVLPLVSSICGSVFPYVYLSESVQ